MGIVAVWVVATSRDVAHGSWRFARVAKAPRECGGPFLPGMRGTGLGPWALIQSDPIPPPTEERDSQLATDERRFMGQPGGFLFDGAAQESNLPSVGLRRRTGFEDQLGHRPQPLHVGH
jgi:hypothetical protein